MSRKKIAQEIVKLDIEYGITSFQIEKYKKRAVELGLKRRQLVDELSKIDITEQEAIKIMQEIEKELKE